MSLVLSVVLLLALVFLVGGPLAWFAERMKKRALEKAFEGRAQLDEREFFEQYFEARGVSFFVAAGVRKVIESVLAADLSRLSPEDDFSRNIAFLFQSDSMADVEIVEGLQEEFDIRFEESDFSPAFPSSIDGIVELVNRKVAEKEMVHND